MTNYISCYGKTKDYILRALEECEIPYSFRWRANEYDFDLYFTTTYEDVACELINQIEKYLLSQWGTLN